MEELDLSAIMRRYTDEERGYPPYHPVMMVKVLLYAYCIGVPSSRKIERRLEEDIGLRVVAANNTPDFRTISDFRKEHLEALLGLFLQVLKLCQKAGLVKLGHVSLEGTKVKAKASKHQAMSYERLKETEARPEGKVRELLQKAKVVDEASHSSCTEQRGVPTQCEGELLAALEPQIVKTTCNRGGCNLPREDCKNQDRLLLPFGVSLGRTAGYCLLSGRGNPLSVWPGLLAQSNTAQVGDVNLGQARL